MMLDVLKLKNDYLIANPKKQKYVFDCGKKIYFKAGMTNNEMCAEIAACQIGKAINIPTAHTVIAEYEGKLGIASFDIGEYELPPKKEIYFIKEFFELNGFIQMCLFDYIIMNEDRSYSNWGIKNGCVAPLFDHNLSFGGERKIYDAQSFMKALSSPFCVDEEYDNKHDRILDCIAQKFPQQLKLFSQSLDCLEDFRFDFYEQTKLNEQIKILLKKRVQYFKMRIEK